MSAERTLVANDIPLSVDELLGPQWLQEALSSLSDGAPVARVVRLETLESFAVKARFSVQFENNDTTHHLCLKAFTDPEIARRAGPTAVREAKFYKYIAPHLSMRVPKAIACIDRDESRAVLLMEDMIHSGARFCSALEPFTPELVAQSLDQIARLHVAAPLLQSNDWIPSRLGYLATSPHFNASQLQEIMDGPRCETLSRRTSSASLLIEGLKKLESLFADRTPTILHGDSHAGNFYLTDEGPGLTDWQIIQRGNWALDVAYHISAALPEHIAECEERALLIHYLNCLRTHGGTAPGFDQAWDDYRAAQIYGYYHWAITTRVEPNIVNTFTRRLGAGVERHNTYAMLGL